ncbi:cytochrome p450 monooxygenase protein [Rutstroemia sp. NJR-2017a BVV2]|nr:cytochrome p450 monooxygenase protein [Rutstroemia sp. NJR-2017a BVV2]
MDGTTMVSTLLFSTIAVASSFLFFQYRNLQRHIAEAKKSGFKYAISPLPTTWTQSWLPLSKWGETWHEGYQPFRRMGDDTIMIVSAGGNILWTCDPQVIMQVSTRRNDFVKPTEMLNILNIYGPTITAAEGEEHRIFKKVASPSFNDKNFQSVWTGAIEQTEMMTQEWLDNGGSVTNLTDCAAKLALHIISKVFFGKRMMWTDDDTKPGPGHSLTYGRAISAVFKYHNTIFLTPRPILNYSPMKIHKLAREAFVEWGKYMEEMRDSTAKHLQTHGLKEDGTLLEHFVKAGTPGLNSADLAISEPAVLGNIFCFILAGHETSANIFTYAVMLLACRPKYQLSLQAEVDTLMGGRKPHEWSYKEDFSKLMHGRVGALMKETLRLYSALPFIPKVNKNNEQPLQIGNKTHILPRDTLIMINTSATHRNPKYWSEIQKTAGDGPPYPLSDFHPERWLQLSDSKSYHNLPQGAYVPFSEGYRDCPGQRFAQAEFCAAIARLFSEFSLELVCRPGEDYATTLGRVEQQMSSGTIFEMGLKMKESVPLKMVRRRA